MIALSVASRKRRKTTTKGSVFVGAGIKSGTPELSNEITGLFLPAILSILPITLAMNLDQV